MPVINEKIEKLSVAKSFAIRPGISMNPEEKIAAVLVDDHDIKSLRREGPIVHGKGMGPVLHIEEGFFTIPGCHNLTELAIAFNEGIQNGYLLLLFCGYKMKGKFILRKVSVSNYREEWIMQKYEDEYANREDVFANATSILSGLDLGYYYAQFLEHMKILEKLGKSEREKYVKDVHGIGFSKYKKLMLPPRPNKIIPYDF